MSPAGVAASARVNGNGNFQYAPRATVVFHDGELIAEIHQPFRALKWRVELRMSFVLLAEKRADQRTAEFARESIRTCDTTNAEREKTGMKVRRRRCGAMKRTPGVKRPANAKSSAVGIRKGADVARYVAHRVRGGETERITKIPALTRRATVANSTSRHFVHFDDGHAGGAADAADLYGVVAGLQASPPAPRRARWRATRRRRPG